MSTQWDSPEAIDRLVDEIGRLSLAYRASVLELNDGQRVSLLLAGAELAGEMATDISALGTSGELERYTKRARQRARGLRVAGG